MLSLSQLIYEQEGPAEASNEEHQIEQAHVQSPNSPGNDDRASGRVSPKVNRQQKRSKTVRQNASVDDYHSSGPNSFLPDGANHDGDEHEVMMMSSPNGMRRSRRIAALHQSIHDNNIHNVDADETTNALHPHIPASQLPVIPVPRSVRETPKTKSRGRGKRKVTFQEPPEAMKRRLLRHQRTDEYSRIRLRWKRRRYDYTNEQDIGGAVQRTIREALEDAYMKVERDEAQRKREQAEDDDIKSVATADMSVDEQNQMLEQMVLAQSQVEDRRVQEGALSKHEEQRRRREKELQVPYSERMNYWELGHAMPSKKSLDCSYSGSIKSPRKLKAAKTKVPSTTTIPSSPSSPSPLRNPMLTTLTRLSRGDSRSEPRFYYHKRASVKGQKAFLHHRHARKLASRVLCGGPQNILLENRLIKMLLSSSAVATTSDPSQDKLLLKHRDQKKAYQSSDRKQVLIQTLRERAMDVKLYHQYRWPDRQKILAALGLGNTTKVTSLARFADLPCDRDSLQGAYKTVRNKLEAEAATLEESDWEPPTISTFEIEPISLMDGDRNADGIADVQILDSPTCSNGSKTMNGDNDGDIGAGQDVTVVSMADDNQSTKAAVEPLFTPLTAYIHLSGSDPPTPSFPLDPLEVVFGLPDRFAKHYHTSAVDHTTTSLTLSTLLNRMTHSSTQEDCHKTALIEAQIKKFLRESADRNDTKYNRLLCALSNTPTDLPLVAHYQSAMQYLGTFSNFSPSNVTEMAATNESQKRQPTDADDIFASDDESDDADEEEEMLGTAANRVARSMFQFCEKRIQHDGLFRFPRLHLTTALARLCQKLPASAAALLAKPIGEDGQQTAFDTFRSTLGHMERSELIYVDRQYNDSGIHFGELEYIIALASETFGQCTEKEPLNVEFHSWYIAALASCMVLCSGNRIESGAWTCPSTRKQNVSFFDDNFLDHEIRHSLPKFELVRMQLADSIRAMVQVAQNDLTDHRASQAIASFLEWKQAVALLVGNSENSEQMIDSIQNQHKYHSIQWAMHDMPSRESMIASAKAGRTVKLHLLATELENDPGKLDNWRRLAKTLGRLPKSTKQETSDAMEESSTILIPNEWNDHVWNNRMWWLDGLLRDRTILNSSMNVDRQVSADVLDLLKARLEKVTSEQEYSPTANGTEWNTCEVEKENNGLAWLPSHTRDSNINRGFKQYEEPQQPSGSNLESLLPQPIDVWNENEQHSHGSSENCDFPRLPPQMKTGLELRCYRLIITCHMAGAQHAKVQSTLLDLVQSFSKEMEAEESAHWLVLAWLHGMGIDTVGLITR